MGVPKSKKDGRIKRLKLDDPATNHYRYEKSKVREMAEKIIDEIEKELDPESIILTLRNQLKYALGFYENWISVDQNTLACLKIKLEYLFVAHGADVDKKKNLNHRMLHEVHDMVAERYLLKTFNPKTHKDYGSPFKALDEQVKLREVDRDSTLSRYEIQKEIQVLEKGREGDIKVILDNRKKLELIKREMTRARPCSLMVWGICSHPKIYEFDPFLWGFNREVRKHSRTKKKSFAKFV
ncbi:hypothetical protein Rs2_16917 [Raphanus sativus]|nr:hypothetical protein Rs2_16917 [Raphanus sativus]